MMQLISYGVQELADMHGCPLEEIAEWYGADAVRFYYAREESALIGVEFRNGTFAVYGCRLDREGLTYEQMAETLAREFA